VTDRLALAAHNNALWCGAVCRAHGLTPVLDDVAWTSRRRTPPYYPDAVTLSADVGEYDVLARIDASDGASVKDSWSRLDLSMEDFARLVDGQWVWREPAAPGGETTGPGDGRTWRRLDTAEEHSAWVRRWARDPEDVLVLPSTLLEEPGVHFLAAEEGGDPFAAGCIVNVTGGVAGIGNLFAADGDAARAWLGAVPAAARIAGRLPLAGWEAGDGLEAAIAAGCEPIGPLTVWIR